MWKIPCAIAVLLVAGCDYDPGGRCAADQDCLAGQVCAAGLCEPAPPAPPGAAPVAAPDGYAVPADALYACSATAGVLANDADADGDPLTAELVTPPSSGILYLSRDGGFTYVPLLGFLGPDAFTYRATDGVLFSAATTVTLTVAP